MTTPLEQKLFEALYAINRTLGEIDVIMDGASHWSQDEEADHRKLVAARDHIWKMLQRIDPSLKD